MEDKELNLDFDFSADLPNSVPENHYVINISLEHDSDGDVCHREQVRETMRHPAKNETEQQPYIYEREPEVLAMEAATASRSLAAVKAVFETQWREKSANERINKQLFRSSFSTAAESNCVSVASYLLSVGVTFNNAHIELAIRFKAYAILQLFFENGWDINKPIS